MSPENKQYDGPLLSVRLIPSPAAAGYRWEVMMSASDYSATRMLGYQARGDLSSLDQAPGEFLIEVHDENIAKWTPMPLKDRKDIRAQIETLLDMATKVMKPTGHV